MKWIGQHIVDLIARFRSDVYLEDVSTGTIASGGNLGLDSNNKIVKATEATGDITSVSLISDSGTINGLTGAVSFTIEGGEGVDTSATGSTLTITGEDASTSNKGLASFASADFHVGGGAVGLADECIVFDYLDGDLIQTSSESFVNDDTSIMTSAAIQDKIQTTLPTKRLHYVHTSAKHTGSSMTSETYVSLADSDRETTTELNLAVPLVAPATGVLKRVLVNTQSALSAKTWSFKLKKVPSGTIASTTTLIATVTANAGGASHTNHIVDFTTDASDAANACNFETGYSTSTQFSVGDRILFSTQCTSGSGPSGQPKINYTFVFEVDDTTAY